MKTTVCFIFLFWLLIVNSACTLNRNNEQLAANNIQNENNSNKIESENSPNEREKTVEQHVEHSSNQEKEKNDEEKSLDFILYNGPIEHIFFHPLVIYPSLAFDGDQMSKGYNDYFVTVKEFNQMIQSLYEKNYMLIKMSDVFEETIVEGRKKIVKKELKFPKDKKPLIISVDDINYYRYMIENGNAYKLIIDSKGSIATYSKDLAGDVEISEENEIIPLLNTFIQNHPDFSFQGAKGILALTGYEGVLGYRTNDTMSTFYLSERNEAVKIINKLKEDGWEFASHGYGHLTTRSISLQTLKNDTNRWLTEVSPLIGPTNIYIYPFGSSVLPDDPKFQYLESVGFQIFCSVGPNPYLSYTDHYAMMDRVHIDGIGLETQQQILARFFDSKTVIDPKRFIFN